MAEPRVSIIIQARDLASRVILGVRTQLSGMATGLRNAFTGITGILAGLGVAIGGAAFIGILRRGVEEAKQAERSVMDLELSVTNLGLKFSAIQPIIEDHVQAVANMARVDDDDVRSALAKLITLTGDVSGSIQRMTLVANLAAKKQMDLGSAAELVGRLMTGQTRILRQMGIVTKDAAEGIEILEQRMSGAAEKTARLFEGMQRRVGVAWGNILESFGTFITQNQVVLDKLEGTAEKMEEFNEGGIKVARTVHTIVSALQVLGNGAKMVINIFNLFLTPFVAVATGLRTIGVVIFGVANFMAQVVNLVIDGVNVLQTGLNRLNIPGIPETLIPKIPTATLDKWADSWATQIGKNVTEIKNAWKAAGSSIGEAFADASRADELEAEFKAGRIPGAPAAPITKLDTFRKGLESKDAAEVAKIKKEIAAEEAHIGVILKDQVLTEKQRTLLLERQADLKALVLPPAKKIKIGRASCRE